MLKHDKALALSAVEVELLRDLRSRLNRRAVSEAALNALGAAFVQACGRVGLPAAAGGPAPTLEGVAAADMVGLGLAVGALNAARAADRSAWTRAVAAGLPQAVLSRRLALAGREQPAEV